MSSYDYYVTVECPEAYDQGVVDRILEDYLTGDPVYEGNAESYYEMGLAAGESYRDEYTAEELFIWAWEVERDGRGMGPARLMSALRHG